MKMRRILKKCKLGEALALTLELFVDNNKIPDALAVKILNQFDRSIYNTLVKKTNAKVFLKGKVENYNFVQNVWFYKLKDVSLTIEARYHDKNTESYNFHVDKGKCGKTYRFTLQDSRVLYVCKIS